MIGTDAIRIERSRQLDLGHSRKNDAEYPERTLSAAAECYISAYIQAVAFLNGEDHFKATDMHPPFAWPFPSDAWHPSDDPRTNLVKAGALIAAEYDAFGRVQEKRQQEREIAEHREIEKRCRYLMLADGKRSWLTIYEAGVLFDNGWINVEIGGTVIDTETGEERDIHNWELSRIAEIADEYSASK